MVHDDLNENQAKASIRLFKLSSVTNIYDYDPINEPLGSIGSDKAYKENTY